ncbi:ATP-binding cassette domain-containing protein [Streptomyces milbemycinicus]|uniref:ATP-binding cassette domain-containing protein n=1 Tax=Streptomyces milbemycinicus TaxID=476552 RepID=A0ABW8LS82_9ACTN
MTDLMIEARGLGKTFGAVRALDGVDLDVPRGSVLGLLGHNGSGKTTMVNLLTTLVRPSAGVARVAGFDVVRQSSQVRRRIGLTGQFATVDERISGQANLEMIARLLGADRRAARARTAELLEMFGLSEAADRLARTYSGGMRRRLDVAASLVGRPDVVFLDEPTTGLDPTVRQSTWNVIKRLVREGSTVLLTTQYLDEADRLADSVVVLSEGRVVAAGTPSTLKAAVGARIVRITLAEGRDLPAADSALRRAGFSASGVEKPATLSLPIFAPADLAAVVRALDDASIEFGDLAVSEPGLDEAYMAIVGSNVPPAVDDKRRSSHADAPGH